MDPRSSGQDILRCISCETEASLYCDACCVHLCKDCVDKHLSEKSKVHKLVSLKQYLATPKCQDHKTKLCEFHCENCGIPICSKCVTSKRHKNHDVIDFLENYQNKLKKNLQKDLEELEKTIYPKYLDGLSNIQFQKALLRKKSKLLTSSLTKQGEVWHKEVDAIIQKLQLSMDNNACKQLAALEKVEDNYSRNINMISIKIHDLKKSLGTVESGLISDYCSENEKFRRLPSIATVSFLNFEPKAINENQLLELFGSMSTTSIGTNELDHNVQITGAMSSSLTKRKLLDVPQIVKDIETNDENLHSVTCLGDEHIWSCGLDNVMKLYNLRGEVLSLVKTTTKTIPQDIAMTRNGHLAYTEYENRSITISKNAMVDATIKFQGWKPWGLCSTHLGDLLAFMVSRDNKESKVVRYIGSTEKQSIQWDEKGKPLYPSGRQSNTKYLAENKNFDICVAARAVVVVSSTGKFRFRYSGNPNTRKESFDPVGIATDSQGNILIADCYNQRIHILDQDGHFERYIENCALNCPWGLCITSRDDLFVVVKKGRVKKIKYYE